MKTKYDISDSPREDLQPDVVPLDVWAERYKGSKYLPFTLHPFIKYRYGITDIVCPIESVAQNEEWQGRPIPFFIKKFPSLPDFYTAGGPLKKEVLHYMERSNAVLEGVCLNTPQEMSPLRLFRGEWSLFIRKKDKKIKVLAALEKFKGTEIENRRRKCFINKDLFFKSIPDFEVKQDIMKRLHVMHGIIPNRGNKTMLPLQVRRTIIGADSKTIAKKIGIGLNQYEEIEKGLKSPTMSTIIKLAQLYNVTPDIILEEFNYNIRYTHQDLTHIGLSDLNK